MCGRSVPANDLFSYRNLHERYLDCRKNKRNSVNALRFEINAEDELFKLENLLRSRAYHPSRSILFAARKPKLREIFASDFKDRVVHHVLINELEKIWEPIFIHDSYACRKRKGTHKAVVRLRKFLRQITKNGNVRAHYLQLDIKDFFTSIDKNILIRLIQKRLSSSDLLWLCEKIIYWDCTTSYISKGNSRLLNNIPPNKSLFNKDNARGLPIGNLSSQFFANVYLNELDKFVKHQLKAKFYIRYVDDFVILDADKERLIRIREEIRKFLMDILKLQLHPRRQRLQSVSDGIDFLGYIVRHDYVLVRRRVVNNFKAKLKINTGCIPSYMGHFKYANAFRLMNNLSKKEVRV